MGGKIQIFIGLIICISGLYIIPGRFQIVENDIQEIKISLDKEGIITTVPDQAMAFLDYVELLLLSLSWTFIGAFLLLSTCVYCRKPK